MLTRLSGDPQWTATFLAAAKASISASGSMSVRTRTGITKVLCRSCSWTQSWMAMAASHVPGIGDSLRIRPRSVTRYHSPSMMMYLPPLVWIPKVPTSRSQTAKSSWGAELKGLTSYRASPSSSEASRAS